MSLAHHALPDVHLRLLHNHALTLQEHMQDCRERQGRWTSAALFAEHAHGLVAQRFVTTVAVVCAGLALTLGWL